VTELGLYVRLDTPAETIRTLARAAEEAGYRGFWMNNPPGQDGLTPLSWAAQATSRITLGSGVIPVSVFTPTASLDQLARLGLPRERYRLGIGSGAGPHPIQRVRAALRELRPAPAASSCWPRSDRGCASWPARKPTRCCSTR
jgi:alkanesulfonate monooxygenase SsuD/methylene tetrahydromethanopterin reductase-like flavin-dependent oxidoreductase (luciferase family)